MSSRQIKRLLKNKTEQKAESPSDEEDEEVVVKPKKTPFNSFSLLDSDGEDKEKEEDDNDDEDVPQQQQASSSKKKNKKKTKKKNKKDEPEVKAPAASMESKKSSGDVDVDSLVESIEQSLIVEDDVRLTGRGMHLLKTEAKYFDSEQEMTRLFGADVVRAARSNNNQGNKPARGGGRRNPHNAHFFFRHTSLARARDTWPRHPPHGISMKQIASPSSSGAGGEGEAKNGEADGDESGEDGAKWFELVWDADYQREQTEYEARVATFEPQAIAYFLHDHPYHADALIQMSEIYKHHGEFAVASELIERCLYRLECAFHLQFTPMQANSRLHYDHMENRAFFMGLYRHVQFLGRKGAARAALEFNKLLLSISPDLDPLCAILFIDYYALRAKEYEWLREFISNFRQTTVVQKKVHHSVRLLPNLSYSLALAHYLLQPARPEVACGPVPLPPTTTDRIGAAAQASERKEENEASICLQQALLMYPEMIEPLLKKCQESELSKPRWVAVLSHAHFQQASRRREAVTALKKLIDIYVEKVHVFWKAPEVLDWLLLHAEVVISKLAEGSVDEPPFANARNILFHPRHVTKYSRLVVSEYSDMITTLPADDLPALGPGMNQANLEQLAHLPPQVLAQLQAQLEAQWRAQHGADMAPPGGFLPNPVHVDPRNVNPVLMFLMSMLPWVNVQGNSGQIPRPDYFDEDEDAM